MIYLGFTFIQHPLNISCFLFSQSPVISHQSPVTSPQSPVTSPQSPVTSPRSPFPVLQFLLANVKPSAMGTKLKVILES
ncbi:hypothetical protein H6F47_14080 [Sphaerospermopsis sp. FACHB-1094]|uniref:hypothetical protein n=1 Tax=Sphaerospermopsis sp. FACHB-1094 TaxID=2692861 RepID=UPI001683A81C|nr:hypothetical protein [Sphaerospermopsis sp. FACHB-1094]MBD2133526.1 hypothetical protein [Sphaerospermopsis sp. FACHB-1094]